MALCKFLPKNVHYLLFYQYSVFSISNSQLPHPLCKIAFFLHSTQILMPYQPRLPGHTEVIQVNSFHFIPINKVLLSLRKDLQDSLELSTCSKQNRKTLPTLLFHVSSDKGLLSSTLSWPVYCFQNAIWKAGPRWPAGHGTLILRLRSPFLVTLESETKWACCHLFKQ